MDSKNNSETARLEFTRSARSFRRFFLLIFYRTAVESIRNLNSEFFPRTWLGDILDVLGDGLHHLQIGKLKPKEYGQTDNNVFRNFQSKFMKNLFRKGLKPQYVAVREQSKEKHQHYHVALLLDGHKTQSIHNHIATAERLWDSTLGLPARENGYGLIDDCTPAEKGKNKSTE